MILYLPRAQRVPCTLPTPPRAVIRHGQHRPAAAMKACTPRATTKSIVRHRDSDTDPHLGLIKVRQTRDRPLQSGSSKAARRHASFAGSWRRRVFNCRIGRCQYGVSVECHPCPGMLAYATTRAQRMNTTGAERSARCATALDIGPPPGFAGFCVGGSHADERVQVIEHQPTGFSRLLTASSRCSRSRLSRSPSSTISVRARPISNFTEPTGAHRLHCPTFASKA